MKKKIIIIGKKSFVGSNLFNFLKYKFNIKIYNYKKFINVNTKLFRTRSYVIHCSLNKQYVYKKYSEKSLIDLDIKKLKILIVK